MAFLLRLWNRINGNKTKIGVAISAIGKVVAIKDAGIGATIETVGNAVAVGGLGHAGLKLIGKK